MNIAFFTPLPPVKSGISEYSENLLDCLNEQCKVTVFIDEYEVLPNIKNKYKVLSFQKYEEKNRQDPFDLNVFQVGNNYYHHYMHDFILSYGGITVLHDYVLHHSLAWMTLVKGEYEKYIEEMEYNYSEIGRELAQLRLRGIWSEFQHFLYPLNKRYIQASSGIIVHSEFIKNVIEETYPDKNVKKINMGIPFETNCRSVNKKEIKQKLNIKTKNFIVGIFGFATPMKQTKLILQAFSKICADIPDALLLIIGAVEDPDIYSAIEDLDLENKILAPGFVSNDNFVEYITITDVACNIRYPTAGETSATLLNLMKHEIPVIIFNYRQFAEIPDSCCVKIDLDKKLVEQIYDQILFLYKNSDKRKQIGANAKNYVIENHSINHACNEYIAFFQEMEKTVIRDRIKNNIFTNLDQITDRYVLENHFKEILMEMEISE